MADTAGINRRLPINATPALTARFWSRVAKGAPEACWNWTASFRNGYGAIKHEGRVLSAHRVAYVLTHGEHSSDLIVAHKCDNKACCNPEHLEAVSAAKNNRDAFERGDRAPTRGEMRPNAVLNEQTVARIWTLHQEGKTHREIGAAIGVKHKTVGSVLCGKSWKHLRPKAIA